MVKHPQCLKEAARAIRQKFFRPPTFLAPAGGVKRFILPFFFHNDHFFFHCEIWLTL